MILDNSNLKIASSRNYHHFFPKKHLKINLEKAEPNLIANITMIDGYSNKHKIGKKAPNDYIDEFSQENNQINNTLKSHLINDISEFGIETNDYHLFLQKRSHAIAAALNEKMNLEIQF